ncbi:Fimbrial protein-like protein [Pseudomonas sp. JV551A1]|uniref:fimbrial protein n=1 Tax=Pseudomonas sp. JV551A1 TaxID=2078787 RepID=UPI00100D7F9C|nr:fimbrial protein [Pseudomonas sp. JV551A1]SPO54032.1 Fimbrial protein-like protein [Pseudomonas sp. JV551A1]
MSIIGCTAPRPVASVTCALALGLLCSEAQARCEWEPGPTYLTFEYDAGTLWVPRDAEVGREIASLAVSIENRDRAKLECFYSASPLTTISMPASTAIAVGVPVRGQRFADSVLRTNVDGIGAIITTGFPYNGSGQNTFTSDDGSQAIPYRGTMRTNTSFAAPMSYFYGRVKLVKTGPIAPGEHHIDKEMFHGITNDKGKVMDFTLKALVKQAQCTLLGNPVSADPVKFDDHTLADFTGPGPVGTEVGFSITLSDCDDNSSAPTAYAHIELDGTTGSSVVDAKRGIFSLGTGSTAAGFGIQILHGDGRELPLQEAVEVKKLNVGVTQLDFKARYYQLDTKVKDGLAKAALKFTMSYR